MVFIRNLPSVCATGGSRTTAPARASSFIYFADDCCCHKHSYAGGRFYREPQAHQEKLSGFGFTTVTKHLLEVTFIINIPEKLSDQYRG